MTRIAPRRCAALLLLCLVAQASPAVPLDDVAEQPDAAIVQDDRVDKAIPANPALGGGLSHAALFRGNDDVERGGDGAPVAEPSTLLLVSLGLFGLIAWSRWRR